MKMGIVWQGKCWVIFFVKSFCVYRKVLVTLHNNVRGTSINSPFKQIHFGVLKNSCVKFVF